MIYTKLIEYPYEFGIDSNLRLASIDNVKIADNGPSTPLTEEELNAKIDAKVGEKVNEKLSFCQKLRSDEYEEVPFVDICLFFFMIGFETLIFS